MMSHMALALDPCLAVVPVLTGPLQLLLTLLPALLFALFGLIASLLKPQAIKTGLRLLWRLKLPLAAVVAGAAGVAWAAQSLWPTPHSSGGVAEASDHDWPMFRGGPARTGIVHGSASPMRGSVHWTWQEGAAAVLSSPAIVGNRVYISTAVMSALGGGSGEIICFDADTGDIAWQAAPPGYRATFSSPVVAGTSLVCGEGLHFIHDARVICLDLRPGREGQVRWTHATKSHVECTPVVFQNRVYVGAGEDGYYCLELEPDADGKARVVWHVPGEQYQDAETSLAVWQDAAGRTFVYAGLGLGGKALCVLDAATGSELRRVAVDYPVFGPPTIADGRLLVGMGNGDFVHPAAELGAEPAGAVCCFDLAKLNNPSADPLLWTYKTNETVLGAVAVVESTAYFGSRDGWLHAVRASDGVKVATWNAHAPIVTSPAVSPTHVFVMTDAGVLYALDRPALEPVWETKLGNQPLFISSPAVARGHVYVGSQFDGLSCIGEPGQPAVPLWPGHAGGPGRGGNPQDSPLPDVATFHWQYPTDQAGETKDAHVAAPPAALGNNLFIPLAGAERAGLACLPIDVASEEAPPPRWVYATKNPVVVSPAIVGDAVFLVDGRPGDQGRSLHCVGVNDGQLRWKIPVASAADGMMTATTDRLYVLDEDNRLSERRLEDGRLKWQCDLSGKALSPTVFKSLLVAAVVDPSSLMLLDRPTGGVLWRQPLASVPSASPVVDLGVVFIGTAEGLEARSLVGGQPLTNWNCTGGGVSSDIVLLKDRIAYVSSEGRLVLVDRATGATLRAVDGATPGVSPVLARGALIFAGPQALRRLSLDDLQAEPSVWTETDWLGAATTPAIVSDSHLYMGRAGWGLVRWGAGR